MCCRIFAGNMFELEASGSKKPKEAGQEAGQEFHFCSRIRNLSGRRNSRDPASLSRSPSAGSLVREWSGRGAGPGILSRTSSWANKISAFLPKLRSFSGDSSDSGFRSHGAVSEAASRAGSRRSSLAAGAEAATESGTDTEDEMLSHVSIFPGQEVSSTYSLMQLLGEGAFSKVYLAESKKDFGGFAAVKIIDKEELNKDEDKMFLVDKEIEIMSQLDHPNVVKLLEVYENKQEVTIIKKVSKLRWSF